MARIGKIARLPRYFRTQLNERLADGEPASVILSWLNENQFVREVLDLYFEGNPITRSNLSDWRKGGYEEWLRHQEARESARAFLHEAEELEEELDGSCLTDRVTEIAALALLKLLREAQTVEGPAKHTAVLNVVRELQRLRRGDHEMRQVRIKEARWETEQAATEKAGDKDMQQDLNFQKNKIQIIGRMLWEEYRDGMAKGTLTPERAAQIRNLFEKSAAWHRKCSVPDLPREMPPQRPKSPPPVAPNQGKSC